MLIIKHNILREKVGQKPSKSKEEKLMKTKVLAALIVFAMCLAAAACGGSPAAPAPAGTPNQDASGGTADALSHAGEAGDLGGVLGAELVMIINADNALGINDRGWNAQGWSGFQSYAEANGMTATWYRPGDNSTQGYLNAISTAINSGGQVVVGMGVQTLAAIEVAREDYPNVKFISVESFIGDDASMTPNHLSLIHALHEGGYLAGMTAVSAGFKEIGIITGRDVIGMTMWTWGMIQGVNDTAARLGINDINLRHTFMNSSTATPETQALAASWYADGVEVILCMVAGGNNSVFAAATAANMPVFGADVDQSGESPMVLTSPIRLLDISLVDAVGTAFDGTFQGGREIYRDTNDGFMGMATETWRLDEFGYTVEDYNRDLEDFKNDVGGKRTGIITPLTHPAIEDDLWAALDQHINFNHIR